MRIHRLITSVFLALIGLHAQVIMAAEQLTLATWNAGMFDRPVSALDLALLNDTSLPVGSPFAYTKAEVISGKEIVH